ncbi:DUF3488 and DUF4129 domain-containing transglutaminase family protein [Ferrimonas balearica]|uniref:transglutaminase TgpA family protein n=1 Tax=Ferrimonas balearica TaxID=44012 RepID=UPI001C99566A|nr:DUF3488 and DUF4129 domain-containing transglutaminase family protein [Ferrimonas balearica]MBY5920933.1 DUF3488 and DUF4129 domain-containing transglutaminase family protein [Ferrimonas balearica]MBY5996382.1 DUF3488 and DUF4129 domain-containing transglutaminase family protein [Ferrimonas balearica]
MPARPSRRPISRRTQGWLLLAQVAIILPLANHCTPWTLAILTLCLLWRLGIFFGRVAKPPRLLVNLLGLGALITLGLVVSHVGMLSALINLLVLAYGLKTIEIRHHGDLSVVVLTGFFLIGLHTLDRFGPGVAPLLLFCVWLNIQVLLSIYRPGPLLAGPKLAAQMLLLSLPLALLLFLLVPRIGPLWKMHGSTVAHTGLSETLELGDIAQLGRSGELAFRASFDGPTPAPEALYWRALVLDRFDGVQWQGSPPQATIPLPSEREGQNYTLTVQPSHQTWLATLPGTTSFDPRIGHLTDGRLLWMNAPSHRQQLTLQWQPENAHQLPLSPEQRRQYLALPTEGNARSRAWAQTRLAESGDPTTMVQSVLDHFREAPYRYTLSPPPLGTDQIDSFLFQTQAGFCGHYASSLVFLARAAGIPARLITGYQGGDLSPDRTVLTVYQFNAHAWVELYLPERGWVLVDPTAAVAPSRVEQGPEVALADDPEFLAEGTGLLRWHEWPLARALHRYMSLLDHRWSQWVLGFDTQKQQTLWRDWFGQFRVWDIALVMAMGIGLLALFQAWLLGLWRWPKATPAPLHHYRRALKLLSRHGLAMNRGEGPQAYLRRLTQQRPDLNAPLTLLTERYLQQRFDPNSPPDTRAMRDALQALEQALKDQRLGFSPRSSTSRI